MKYNKKNRRFIILYGLIVLSVASLSFFDLRNMIAVETPLMADKAASGEEYTVTVYNLWRELPPPPTEIGEQLGITPSDSFTAAISMPAGGEYRAKEYIGPYKTWVWLKFASVALLLCALVWLTTSLCMDAFRRNYFTRKSILLTRTVGFLMIVTFTASVSIVGYRVRMLEEFFAANGITIVGPVKITTFEVVAVLFIFIFAEMLRIGRNVNEENKMTV